MKEQGRSGNRMTAKNPTWQTSRNTDRQQKNPNKRAREK